MKSVEGCELSLQLNHPSKCQQQVTSCLPCLQAVLCNHTQLQCCSVPALPYFPGVTPDTAGPPGRCRLQSTQRQPACLWLLGCLDRANRMRTCEVAIA